MKVQLNFFLLVLVLFVAVSIVRADVHLPDILGNSMVLQRNTSIPIWGTTSANAIIEIKINKTLK